VTRMNLRRHAWSARWNSQRCGGTLFSVTSLLSRGMTLRLELIPTVTMESRHSVDGPTSTYIVRELWGLNKNDPLLGKIFKILFQKDSPLRGSTSCVQIS